MARPKAQAPPAAPPGHLVLYDGVCGLCDRLIQFLLRHDRRGVFSFAALQSPIGRSFALRSGGNPDELTSFYVISDFASSLPRVFMKSEATLFVAGALGWPWKAAAFLRVVPRSIRDRAYDLVARNRYRLFGRHDQCLVTAEFRNRFID